MKPIYLLLVVLAVGFIGATFWISYDVLSQGSTDLYPTWQAGKFFWEEGISPYDDRIGEASQDQIYGRPAKDGEDQFHFVYPFYSIFHIGFLPLVSFQLAAGIYIELLLVGMLLALAMTLHTAQWLPSPIVLAVLLLFTLLGYFTVRGLLLAQPGMLVYVLHVASLWAIFKRYDALAGVLLAASTLKPQNSFLVVPLVILWAWTNHRRQIIRAFAIIFATLMIFSFLLEPTWFGDWLSRVNGYAGYAETYPTTYILADVFPSPFNSALYMIFSGLLVLWMLYHWKNLLGEGRQLLWVFFLTATVTLLISPRTATTSYVELYPVIYLTAMLMTRQKQTLWVIIAGLLLIFGYWALHIGTVPPKDEGGAGGEARIVYVVFPSLVFFLLWIYRREWPQLEPNRQAG